MKKGHSATQPKSGWYKGGSATTPGKANYSKARPTTAHRPSGRGK